MTADRKLGPTGLYWRIVAALAICAACAPAATPGGAGGAPAPPSAAAPSAQAPSEWDRTVAAARQEGKVVVIGINTADAREALTEGFQRRYPEIQIEYNGQSSSEFATKIIGEQQAGRHLIDVIVNGTSGMHIAVNSGVIEPLAPYMTGPESREEPRWLNGRFEYADTAAKHNLVMMNITAPTLTFSPSVVPPGTIKSYRDLLDPKWRGKIAMFDPRVPGTGQAMATFLYLKEGLGPDFLRQLFAQNLIFSRDARQVVDWVVRGQYSLELGGSQQIAADLRSKGVSVEMLGDADMAEGSYLTAGSGSLAVPNRPPHPNAARVYVDWLLSQEGQHALARAMGYASRRQDVPSDHVPAYLVPRAGRSYVEVFKEPVFDLRDDIVEFIRANVGS
jgi:iron(III) transport system substrate-binding protein